MYKWSLTDEFSHISDFKKIGKFFGKVAEKFANFAKCMFPKLFGEDGCLKQAINSVQSSCKNGGKYCKVVVGGKNSNCLKIIKMSHFNYYYGKKFHNNTRFPFVYFRI